MFERCTWCTSSVHLLCFRRRRKHGCDLDELPHYLAHHLPLRFTPDRASSLGPCWSLHGGVHGLGFWNDDGSPQLCTTGHSASHSFHHACRLFVSPVMWTAEMAMERGAWGEAALWNPMVLPITMVRHGLEGKMVELPSAVILSSVVVAIAIYVVGTIVFSKYERGR